MAIVTRGERIEAIIPHRGAGRYAKDATTVDAGGLYAIPGLIDSHVHLATAPNRRYAEALLRRDVYSGITAVRDMAGDARFLADLSRDGTLVIAGGEDGSLRAWNASDGKLLATWPAPGAAPTPAPGAAPTPAPAR